MRRRRTMKWARRLRRESGSLEAARWLVRATLGPAGRMCIHPGGRDIAVRVPSPDLEVALTTLGGEFDALRAALPRLTHPFVVDGGGYIGTAAIALAEAYPEARVITLEPDPENFALLARNVAPYANIVARPVALAAEVGERPLHDRGTGPWGFTLVAEPADRAAAKGAGSVPCTTLAALMEEFAMPGIGVLKLDIEGAEHVLLTADTGWIARTEAICVELHERIVPGCTAAWDAAVAGRRNTRLKGEKVLSLAPFRER